MIHFNTTALNTAIATAFNIFELCEHILEHLPIKDLLFAKKFCRGIKSVIDTSPTLQAHLFSTPLPEKKIESWVFGAKCLESISDEAFRALKKINPPKATQYRITPVVCNPLIVTTYDDNDLSEPLTDCLIEALVFDFGLFFLLKKCNATKLASSRTMFLTQPPRTTVGVAFDTRPPYWAETEPPRCKHIPHEATTYTIIQNDNGVTLSNLLDALERYGQFVMFWFPQCLVITADVK